MNESYVNLGDVCDYIITGKLDANAASDSGPYPFFTCSAEPLRIDEYAYDDDVIILAGNGEFYLFNYCGKFNAYQRNYILKINKNYSKEYIFYCLKLAIAGLKQKSQGSIIKFLTIGMIRNVPIKDIPYSEQAQVAASIAALDKKIDLNRQLNDNLEAMAQALYDYWFVQFDFPDENGKPYKSSGGKMVWNDKLQRKIPEGWQVKKIEDVVETCLGGTPNTSNIEYWYNGDIPWVSSGDLSYNPLLKATSFITPLGLNNSAAKLMPKGTVVVSLVRYIRPSILGIDAAGNQSVVGLLATESFPTCFLYPYIKSEVPRLMSLRTGAQQPHINKSVIDTSWISFPNDELIMQRYNNVANNLYDKIMRVAKEKELLNQQRDFLLPLLMNGQVQVKPQGVNYRLTAD